MAAAKTYLAAPEATDAADSSGDNACAGTNSPTGTDAASEANLCSSPEDTGYHIGKHHLGK